MRTRNKVKGGTKFGHSHKEWIYILCEDQVSLNPLLTCNGSVITSIPFQHCPNMLTVIMFSYPVDALFIVLSDQQKINKNK